MTKRKTDRPEAEKPETPAALPEDARRADRFTWNAGDLEIVRSRGKARQRAEGGK